MQQVEQELTAATVGKVMVDEPLSNYTTWKIGGPADLFIVPTDKEQLTNTINILYKHGVPWSVVGKGSNMLVSDRGIRGAVIQLGKQFGEFRFEGDTVYAGGALSTIILCLMAGRQGLTGLEFAGGIPGTIGGAVYMNAGAHGSDISNVLMQAEVLTEHGELVTYSAADMKFSYRYSRLQDEQGIVTEAVFKLRPGDRKQIAADLAHWKQKRLKTQPLKQACAGSVFRNPPGDYAARLVEAAGLKGTMIGGAQISTLHGNFIVNIANATAQDVMECIQLMQSTVANKFGIELVPEVLIKGDW